jgi:2-phosphosulfolactate phosphatase
VSPKDPPLDIHLTSFPASARNARGTIVAIDAFRAFTTAAYAFASGAEEIVMVGELDEARALKESGRVDISIGERGGLKPDDFDLPNSPTVASERDFTGKRLVQTTTNGTAALAAAPEGTMIYAAALVNAGATGEALRGVSEATIIAAGRKGEVRAAEDELCATYIKAVANRAPYDADALGGLLGRWFGDEAFLTGREPYGPRTDWTLALQLDRFDFAIKVAREDGLLVARAA